MVYESPKKVPTIYNKALKALYGTVDASKLLFDDVLSFLVDELRFKVNNYEMCVEINAQIVWHVDDLKISHVDPKEMIKIIQQLNNKYCNIMHLSVSRNKVREYLGMMFDSMVHKEVKITMFNYINNLTINALDTYKLKGGFVALAQEGPYDIRDIDDDREPLDKTHKMTTIR